MKCVVNAQIEITSCLCTVPRGHTGITR